MGKSSKKSAKVRMILLRDVFSFRFGSVFFFTSFVVDGFCYCVFDFLFV